MIHEFYPKIARLTGDSQLISQVESIKNRVLELSQLLVYKLKVEDVGAWYPHRVTYHPTCHSLRMLKIGDAPLRLLRNVRGIDLVELPQSEECCGFGGTFSIKNADTSIAMLQDKIHHINETGATVCSAADDSCLMHIAGGLSRQESETRPVHLAEILASTEETATSRLRISLTNGHRIMNTPTFQQTPNHDIESDQLRRHIGFATKTRREKRKTVVQEMPDWEELREAGQQIKDRLVKNLASYLLQPEESVQRAGGHVHWARDGEEANQIIIDLVKDKGVSEVVKVKSITTDEIKLNDALQQ